MRILSLLVVAFATMPPTHGFFLLGTAAVRQGTLAVKAEQGQENQRMMPSATSRRDLVKGISGFGLLSFVGIVPSEAAFARGLPTGPTKSELLEKANKKKTEEEKAALKAQLAVARKERLQRQREIEAEEAARKANVIKKEGEIDIEADLRANYYYPTARKRYLPRIKAVADTFAGAKGSLNKGDWAALQTFTDKEADNAALPLKLFASSLTGQGLSLEVSYVKVLNDQGDVYAKHLELLKQAVKSKDKDKATLALNQMEASIFLYRKTARIDTPDGGVGEFPTDNHLGASFSNNNPTLYNRKM